MGESPRWHNGRLWFADMLAGRVFALDVDSVRLELIAEFDDRTSGLGFLPDGTPIVVLMRSKRIMAIGPDRTTVHADLAGITADRLNDMIVDVQGRAYVDCLTDPPDLSHSNGPPLTETGNDRILLVHADGRYEVVAETMVRPNGLALTADGMHLIVAELPARRLRSFSVESSSGRLAESKLFALIPDSFPDGICLDAEGGVWIASPFTGECSRVMPGGIITERFRTNASMAIACSLHGQDRRTLFIMTAEANADELRHNKLRGFVETVEVAVPGVGLP